MRNELHCQMRRVSTPILSAARPTATSLALALAMAAGASGCVSAADADPSSGGAATATGSATTAAAAATANTAGPTFPSTCADIAATADPGPLNDGDYLLFVDGDPSQPWVAYCLGMAGSSPTEYLTLHRTDAGSNFSQYTAGGAAPGVNATSSYTRIRINPATLAVDSSDETFATSTGLVHHGDIDVTSMPYAVAMSCDDAPSGIGNLDLQGTPFTVQPGAFSLFGADPQGAAVYGANNQVVNLTGGGFCGAIQPAPGVFNPFNTNGSNFLTLVHL